MAPNTVQQEPYCHTGSPRVAICYILKDKHWYKQRKTQFEKDQTSVPGSRIWPLGSQLPGTMDAWKMRCQEKERHTSGIQPYPQTKQREAHLDVILTTSCIDMLQQFRKQHYDNEGRARHHPKGSFLPKDLKHFLHYHTVKIASSD